MSVYRIKEMTEAPARARESGLGLLKAYLKACHKVYAEYKPFLWAVILVVAVVGSAFATNCVLAPVMLSAVGLVFYLWVCDVG